MEFYVPRAETAFQLNQWGLLEPDPAASAKVELGDLAGLLVPGVAFDSACNRLGRGGGYYDRLLALVRKINPKAVKIGIAHDRQIFVAELPVEPLDIRMDGVLTESRWFVSANFSALAARGSLCWESEVERKNS